MQNTPSQTNTTGDSSSLYSAPAAPSNLLIEPLDGEPVRAFRAFCYYATVARSLGQTARAMQAERRTVQRWAKKYHWRERIVEYEMRVQEQLNTMRLHYAMRLTPLAARTIEQILRDDDAPAQVRASLATEVLRGLGILKQESRVEVSSPSPETNPLVQALREISRQVELSPHGRRMEPVAPAPVETTAVPADAVPAARRTSGDRL